jgi:hypothetical protein
MKLRAAILGVLAMALAIVAGRSALVAWSLAAHATGMQRLVGGDPFVRLAIAERTVALHPELTPPQARALARSARDVLRKAPLDADALRDLAIARERADQSHAEALLLLAQRVSRRDPPTQNLLLRLAAERGDYRAAFTHLDRILTVNPRAFPIFRETMVALLDDPEALLELARFGNRPWFTEFAFFATARSDAPENLADLLMRSGMADKDHRSAIAPGVLRRLIRAGQYGQARQFAVRFAGATPAQIDDFGLSAATTSRALDPLSWRLASGGSIQASLVGESTVQIDADPAAPAVALERVTLLPPGAYILEQQIGRSDTQQPVHLEWQLACGMRSPPILQKMAPVAGYRLRVDIPEGCPAQHWRLQVQVDDWPGSARFAIGRLRLIR